jgi:short-subunit dehydrogenase
MTTCKGKIIAITGASSGIGRTTALLAASQGAFPILLARSTEALDTLCQEIEQQGGKACCYPFDVTDETQIETVVNDIIKRFGHIDVWVNNAGYGIFSPFVEAKIEDIAGMMDVNYMGVVRCTKAVLPYMLRRKAGHIVTVASVAGKLATPKSSGYAASKFAVIGFLNSVRQEVKGTGVSISTVNPGPVRTPFFDRADQGGTYRQSVEKFMVSPETVARTILRTIHTQEADVTIPRYMNIGVVLSHLFPRFFDRVIAPRLNKK